MGHSSLSTPQTLGLRRRTVGLACIALAMGAMGVGNALAGEADGYPNRPVRLVVSYPERAAPAGAGCPAAGFRVKAMVS